MTISPLYRQHGAPATATAPVLVAVALVTACAAWELYLLLRQRRMYALREIPAPITAALATLSAAGSSKAAAGASTGLAERFEKSQRYGLAKSSLGLARHGLAFAVTLVTLLGGALPALFDAVSSALRSWVPGLAGSEVATTIAFLWLAMLASRVVGLPLDLYRVFVLEEAFGFNKQVRGKGAGRRATRGEPASGPLSAPQTLASFAYDEAVSGALAAALAAAVAAALVSLVAWAGGGAAFFVGAWAVLSALVVGAVLLYPVAIAPLFNRFSALP